MEHTTNNTDNLTAVEDSFKSILIRLKSDPDNSELIAERNRLWRIIGRNTPAYAIAVDSTEDERLDPKSSNFDLDEWKRAIDEVQPITIFNTNPEELKTRLFENLDFITSIIRRLTANITYNELADLVTHYVYNEEPSEEEIRKRISPEVLAQFKKALNDVIEMKLSNLPQFEALTTEDEAKELATMIFDEAVIEVAPRTAEEIILNSPATNKLMKIVDAGDNKRLDSSGNAVFRFGNDFQLKIGGYKNLTALSTTTGQLLLFMIKKFTDTRSKEIIISVDEYMNKRELSHKAKARKSLMADINLLYNADITYLDYRYDQKTQKREAIQTTAHVCSSKSDKIVRGYVKFNFTDEFANILHHGYPSPYFSDLLGIDARRNPYSFQLATKIIDIKNQNVLKKNHGDIVSVKTLLAQCPGMPSYEKVRQGNRNYTARIIEPFQRDMDANSNIYTWEYCHEKGEPLTQEELDNFNYDTFINCYVKTTWKNYPDQTARAERKREQQQKREDTHIINKAKAINTIEKHTKNKRK